MAEKARISQTVAQTAHILTESGWTFDLAFGGLALLVFAFIIIALWRTSHLRQLKDALGMKGFPTWAFVLASGLWLLIFSLLVAGIIVAIPKVALHEPPTPRNKEELWNWRFLLLTLTTLTATLGAVLALPITLYRLQLRKQQAEIADEALFNEKIKAAADDLHAYRQLTKIDKDGKPYNCWEDDVVRRNAAINQLETLVQERPDVAPRVARLLSTYVRELSRKFPPERPPIGATFWELRKWAQGLKSCRSDIENAVQVLGRLQQIRGVNIDEVGIDLRRANLQGFNLRNSWFVGANFDRANLQGADFVKSNLEGSSFRKAYIQGAIFNGSNMDGSFLNEAYLQGAILSGMCMRKANFGGAWLQGANFSGSQLQEANFSGARLQQTSFRGARLNGALFRRVWIVKTDFRNADVAGAAFKNITKGEISIDEEKLKEVFGDGSVILKNGLEFPDFWYKDDLTWEEFRERWHGWRKEKGYDK